MKFVNNLEIIVSPQVIKKLEIRSNITTRSSNSNLSTNNQIEKSNGLIFSFGLNDFFNLTRPVVIVAYATHNVIKNTKLKFFSVEYFDNCLNRISLPFTILASESEAIIGYSLEALKKWAVKNNILKFPEVSYILTDCAPSFFNSFSRVFSTNTLTKPPIFLYCIWHNNRAVKKKITDQVFQLKYKP